jgi:hypothetical protein
MFKKMILISFAFVLCVMATGCMGGQKDIKKSEEKIYEGVVAEACSEYGYEFEKQTVLPLGSELLYQVTDGKDDIEILVNIDEESTYDKVSCTFIMTRSIASADEKTAGLEKHLDVLVKIAEHFTDEITKDVLVEYLNSASWTSGSGEDDVVMQQPDEGAMNHTVCVVKGTAAEYKEGDELEEVFTFWWDNGKNTA